MEEALKELITLIETSTKETVANYSKDYKESKWYKEPTLKDVFGESMASSIAGLRFALEAGEDVFPFVKEFEIAAVRFGVSWYDEDLKKVRTGCEWETKMYTTLRNIAAKAVGIGAIDWHEFYEGYGE